MQIGGKYLDRRQVTLPNSAELLTDAHLYVGVIVPVVGRNFELLEADEFTYQYMENNRHVYPMADGTAALLTAAAAIKAGVLLSQ